jgi:hypothetical protein
MLSESNKKAVGNLFDLIEEIGDPEKAVDVLSSYGVDLFVEVSDFDDMLLIMETLSKRKGKWEYGSDNSSNSIVIFQSRKDLEKAISKLEDEL